MNETMGGQQVSTRKKGSTTKKSTGNRFWWMTTASFTGKKCCTVLAVRIVKLMMIRPVTWASCSVIDLVLFFVSRLYSSTIIIIGRHVISHSGCCALPLDEQKRKLRSLLLRAVSSLCGIWIDVPFFFEMWIHIL